MTSTPALIVVDRTADLTLGVPGVVVMTARDYLAEDCAAHEPGTRLVNLCRYDRYQSRGYYVSLLAEARGHLALPEIRMLGDLRSESARALVDDEFEDRLQTHLARVPTDALTLDIIMGVESAHAHDALAFEIFQCIPAPALRVELAKRGDRWNVIGLRALALQDLGERQRCELRSQLQAYLAGNARKPAGASEIPALAILHDESEPHPPSNPAALSKFRRVGEGMGMRVEFLRKNDIEKLADFSALLIRDTTHVDHYTYEFSRRAADLGMPVIDDPESILKCTNKVFLQELLARHGVPTPKTLLVHKGNASDVGKTLGLPCVLKQPDSEFSMGVFKVETEDALTSALHRLFARSELVVAQEWVPTDFDWRVGVLDRRALYVCKYHMAPGHWQVVKHERHRTVEGRTTTMTVGEAPAAVVALAVRAAGLIGDGLYGVDIKEANGRCYLMEINDNPNIDAGNEDAVLKDAIYREILGVLLRRCRKHEPAMAA